MPGDVAPYSGKFMRSPRNQKGHLNVQGGEAPFDVVLAFSDLQNPVQDSSLLGPSAGIWTEAGLRGGQGTHPRLALGVNVGGMRDSQPWPTARVRCILQTG